MRLPNGSVLKTPNGFCEQYQAVYKDNSRQKRIAALGKTPEQATVNLIRKLDVTQPKPKEGDK